MSETNQNASAQSRRGESACSAWVERVPMLSINPDAATRDDVANLAAELMESRRLLCLVWNHMHGQNMDGSRRPWPGDKDCAANWNKLSDAIGTYLDTPNTDYTPAN